MDNSRLHDVPILGVLAPAFMGLAMVFGAMGELSLLLVALGLAFSSHTRRLLSRV